MRKMKGFTLIELLIVVTIVGILGAMAYSSYTKSLVKGRRAAAKTLVMEISQREQQYLMDNRTYAAIADCAALNTTFGINVGTDVSRYYKCTSPTVPIVAVDNTVGQPPTFTVTLAPYGEQATSEAHESNAGTLAITQAGTKTGPW